MRGRYGHCIEYVMLLEHRNFGRCNILCFESNYEAQPTQGSLK